MRFSKTMWTGRLTSPLSLTIFNGQEPASLTAKIFPFWHSSGMGEFVIFLNANLDPR
jgi:hypothetical protein